MSAKDSVRSKASLPEGAADDPIFSTWRPRRKNAIPSFLTSLSLHTLVVAVAFSINPRPAAREFPAPTVAELLEREEQRVVWYAPKTEMPAVAPAEPIEGESEKPLYRANQDFTVDQPDAQSERQMILGDAPEIPIQQDQDLPNLLSWKAPKVSRPRFQPERPKLIAPPAPRAVEAEQPPEIETAADAGLDVSRFESLSRLRFQRQAPEPEPKPEPERATLEAPPAPEVETRAPAEEIDLHRLSAVARLRYQARGETPPPAPERETLEAEPAPEVRASAPEPDVDAAAFQRLSRLRYRNRAPEPAPARPSRQALAEAPRIEAPAAPRPPGIDAAEYQRLSRLRYQSGDRGRTPAAPRRQSLAEVAEAAPNVSSGAPASAAGVDTSRYQQLSRLRYQGEGDDPLGNIPSPRRRSLAEAVGVEAVPNVGGALAAGQGVDAARYQRLSRLRYRSRTGEAEDGGGAPPVARALAEAAGGAAPEIGPRGDSRAAAAVAEVAALERPGGPPSSLGPGGDQSGGPGGDANLVVVGVDPSDQAPAELPRGSRRARFSAGPDGGPDGGVVGAEGQELAEVRVPNVAVRGAPAAAAALALPSRTPPPEARDPAADLRRALGRDYRNLNAAPNIAWVKDEEPIDLQQPFVGRPTYQVAINMPNVTSYRGDWVIQFAEALPEDEEDPDVDGLQKRAARKDPALTPPWPSVKVDPKYGADAMRERVEGEVVIYGVIQPDGELTRVQLVKKLDDRLDQAALDALAKWRFEPARKAGEAVAVEALVHIPFRLNPNVKMRY